MTSQYNVILPNVGKNLYPFPNMSSVAWLKQVPSGALGITTYYEYMGIKVDRTGIVGDSKTLFSNDTKDYCTTINHTTDFWEQYVENPLSLEYYRTNPEDVLFGSTSIELQYDATKDGLGEQVQNWYFRVPLPEVTIQKAMDVDNIINNRKYIFSLYAKVSNQSSTPETNGWIFSVRGTNSDRTVTSEISKFTVVKESEFGGEDSWQRIFIKVDIDAIVPSTITQLELRINQDFSIIGGDSSLTVDGFQFEEISPIMLDAYGGKLRAVYDGIVNNEFNEISYSEMLKLSSCATTYIDGEVEGCSWDGARNISTSSRTSGLGGYVLNLDNDLLFPVQEMSGWGVSPIENVYSDLNYGGKQYRGTVIKDSVLTLTSSFLQDILTLSSDGLLNLHNIRRRWVDFIAEIVMNKNFGSNKFYIYYTGSAEEKLIEVQYDSGLEGFQIDGNNEVKIPMRFINASGTAQGIGYRIYPDLRARKVTGNTDKTNKSGFVYDELPTGIVRMSPDGTIEQILDTTLPIIPQIKNINVAYASKQIVFASIIGEYKGALYYQIGIFLDTANRVDIFICRYVNKEDHYSVGRFHTNNTYSLAGYKVNSATIIGNKLLLTTSYSSIIVIGWSFHPSVSTPNESLSNVTGKSYYLDLDTLQWDDNVFTAQSASLITISADYDIYGTVYVLCSNTSINSHTIYMYKNFDIYDGATPYKTIAISPTSPDVGLIGLKNNSLGGAYIYNLYGVNIEGDTFRSDAYLDVDGNLQGTTSGRLPSIQFSYVTLSTEKGDAVDDALSGKFLSVVEMDDGSILAGGRFNSFWQQGVSNFEDLYPTDSGLIRVSIGGGYEPLLLGDDRIDYVTKIEKNGEDVYIWYQPKITEPSNKAIVGSAMTWVDKNTENALTSPFILSNYSLPKSSAFHQGYYPQSFFMSSQYTTHVPFSYNGGQTPLNLNSWRQTQKVNDFLYVSTQRAYDMRNAGAGVGSPSSVTLIPYSFPTLVGEIYDVVYEGTFPSPFYGYFYFARIYDDVDPLNYPVLAYVKNISADTFISVDKNNPTEQEIIIDTDINNPTPIVSNVSSTLIPNGTEYDVQSIPNKWSGGINKYRILIFPFLPFWINATEGEWGFGTTYLEIKTSNKYISLD